MRAFAAPYSVMLLEIDNVGMFDTAVEAQGKVFVSTELGGGGSATATTIEIARQGIHNLLIHAGIVRGDPVVRSSTDIDMPDDNCFIFASAPGLYEPCVDLAQPVARGDLVARIWPVDRTGVAPVDCIAQRDGLLVGRHFPGLIQLGDCVAVIGVPTDG